MKSTNRYNSRFRLRETETETATRTEQPQEPWSPGRGGGPTRQQEEEFILRKQRRDRGDPPGRGAPAFRAGRRIGDPRRQAASPETGGGAHTRPHCASCRSGDGVSHSDGIPDSAQWHPAVVATVPGSLGLAGRWPLRPPLSGPGTFSTSTAGDRHRAGLSLSLRDTAMQSQVKKSSYAPCT